jgi:hypothetical protein
MNYEQAEKILREPDLPKEPTETDKEYANREVARNIIILSVARNLERIANALEKSA